MNNLNKIKAEIESHKTKCAQDLERLHARAAETFAENLKHKGELIQSLVSKVENSTELTQVSHYEWLHQRTRVNFASVIDTNSDIERSLLSEYLEENYFVRCDFENDCITYCIGPCLIINEDGDVLDQDSGKWIIKSNDYENESKLYELIEDYMEDTGCFPSVVRMDRYGNAFYVNTQVRKVVFES